MLFYEKYNVSACIELIRVALARNITSKLALDALQEVQADESM